MRKVSLITAVILVVGILLFLFMLNLSSIRPAYTIQQDQLDSLMVLEKTAIRDGDFPIGALIVYKDSIIGSGYNTTKNRDEALGHAEINAIEDMFRSLDPDEFWLLDRDSLILFVSFEPCMMCKGIINHFEIRRVCYLNPKKLRYRLKFLRKDLSFYTKIRKIKSPEDQ